AGHRCAGPQASDDGHVVTRPIRGRVARIEPEREPDLGAHGRELERWRHHRDDLAPLAVDLNRSADDRLVLMEAVHPERVAEHHEAVAGCDVLAAPQPATEGRPDAEDREELRGDAGAGETHRLAAARPGEPKGPP